MSSRRTADLLITLSQHPDVKERFKSDPEGVMTRAGLSEEGKEALRSGDPDKVYEHLGDDAPPGCFLLI